jgi:hypothetical protein
MENWKIKNTSEQSIKVSVATSSNSSPGIILKPGQFCISEGRMTTPLDAQNRRGYLLIEKDFDNSQLNLSLGKAFDESDLDKAKEAVKGYSK